MDDDKSYLYKKKDVAFLFGVSVQALDGWGIEPVKKVGSKSLYYLPDVIKWRLNRDTKETLDLTKERARLAAAQAEKTEMENEKTRGTHIDKSAVIMEAANLINSVKASIRTEGNRHASHAANQKAGTVKKSYDLAIERAFKNVTNSYSNGKVGVRRSGKGAPQVPAKDAAVQVG